MRTRHITGTVCQLAVKTPHGTATTHQPTLSTPHNIVSAYQPTMTMLFTTPLNMHVNWRPNAEAAANRVYSWDEIHPAYRDHLTDSYGEPMQPPVDDDEYYEDVTNEELAEMNRRCME